MEDEWTGRAKGNLYLLDTTATVFSSFSIPYIASNVTCHNKTSAESVSACFDSLTSVKNKCHNVHLWHARLGHPSISRQLLLSLCIPHITLNKDVQFSCSICPLAKQKRLPFPNANHVAPNAFDLIHCDT